MVSAHFGRGYTAIAADCTRTAQRPDQQPTQGRAAPHPANTARIVWGLAQDLVDGLSGHLLSPEPRDPLPDMRAQITAYTEGIERVLAMENGTLRLFDDTVVADWVRAAQEDTR